MNENDFDDIQRRLRALKGVANGPEPTDDEIHTRLQRLKGCASASQSPETQPSQASVLLPPAQNEDADQLLSQYHALIHLESGGRPRQQDHHPAALPPKKTPQTAEDEVEELLRLQADCLHFEASTTSTYPSEPAPRDESGAPSVHTYSRHFKGLQKEAKEALTEARRHLAHSTTATSEPEDEQVAEAERLLEQLQEEIAIEERFRGVEETDQAHISLPHDQVEPAPERLMFPQAPTNVVEAKLPLTSRDEDMSLWCHICTDDAIVWCLGCDNDPYCKRCFSEAHSEPDLRGHKTVPIRRPCGPL